MHSRPLAVLSIPKILVSGSSLSADAHMMKYLPTRIFLYSSHFTVKSLFLLLSQIFIVSIKVATRSFHTSPRLYTIVHIRLMVLICHLVNFINPWSHFLFRQRKYFMGEFNFRKLIHAGYIFRYEFITPYMYISRIRLDAMLRFFPFFFLLLGYFQVPTVWIARRPFMKGKKTT